MSRQASHRGAFSPNPSRFFLSQNLRDKAMYLCYIDESGTSDIPGNTSHFILAGFSIPVLHWKDCEQEISNIKKKYGVENAEIHIAWMLRKYNEQMDINNFSSLDYFQRKSEVTQQRKKEILRLQRENKPALLKQTKKNFIKTENYIHLSFEERKALILDIAGCISKWKFARIFAECIDKIYFDPSRTNQTVDEQAFEQIVSRFEQYLQVIGKNSSATNCGLLIHDNNETISKKHTNLMKQFHQRGTLWTQIHNIIETPLFVDSQLTSMVQIADVCAYALRRYLENGEDELFDLILQRADRKDGKVVEVRHFTNTTCTCKICSNHRK
jgi:hypothetical protein